MHKIMGWKNKMNQISIKIFKIQNKDKKNKIIQSAMKQRINLRELRKSKIN